MNELMLGQRVWVIDTYDADEPSVLVQMRVTQLDSLRGATFTDRKGRSITQWELRYDVYDADDPEDSKEADLELQRVNQVRLAQLQWQSARRMRDLETLMRQIAERLEQMEVET